MVKILVADTQFLTREGLRSIISEHLDIEVIGQANSATELLGMTNLLNPTLVIADPYLDDRVTISDIKSLKTLYPSLPVLVFSNQENMAEIHQLMPALFKNFASKSCGREELIQSIYAAADGQHFDINALSTPCSVTR